MIEVLLDWLEDGNRRSRRNTAGLFENLWAVESEVVRRDGHMPSVPCRRCHHGHDATPKSWNGGWRHHCRAEGWVNCPDEDLEAWLVDFPAFCRSVAAAMRFPAKVQIRAKDRLFQIGTARLGSSDRSMFIARGTRLSSDVSQLVMWLDTVGSKDPGLVLCVGPAPAALRTKHRHRFFALRDAVSLSAENLEIDMDQLVAWSRDLDRPRARASNADEAEANPWIPDAQRNWHSLHGEGLLTSNAAAMGARVRERLIAEGWASKDLPKVKGITDVLRKLHREHYPARRRS